MITVTDDQIKRIKDAYYSNREDLAKVGNCYFVDDPCESFEQGYNNALEYVCDTLGIILG